MGPSSVFVRDLLPVEGIRLKQSPRKAKSEVKCERVDLLGVGDQDEPAEAATTSRSSSKSAPATPPSCGSTGSRTTCRPPTSSLADNIELVPTPTHASYLNRVECHFLPISEFVVRTPTTSTGTPSGTPSPATSPIATDPTATYDSSTSNAAIDFLDAEIDALGTAIEAHIAAQSQRSTANAIFLREPRVPCSCKAEWWAFVARAGGDDASNSQPSKGCGAFSS